MAYNVTQGHDTGGQSPCATRQKVTELDKKVSNLNEKVSNLDEKVTKFD